MEKHSSSPNTDGSRKVKLLCSYGGRIQCTPRNHQLSYIGGHTKILSVSRHVSFPGITSKLNSLFEMKAERPHLSIKYQLPGEDLDALVSLIDGDDVEHMMVENDRMHRISAKPARLRLFIFDVSAPLAAKSGAKDPDPITPSNPDYLFGFDKEYQPDIGPPLDLLQIRPRVVLPENYGLIPYGGVEGKIGITESGVNNWSADGAAAAATQVVYAYGVMPGMVNGWNREQPAVYNLVPVMPSMPEQRMLVSTGNCQEAEGNKCNC